MTDHTAAREAREALDDLHLAAHENGPTTDMSTHFRRARRLWVAMVGEHHMAYGEPVPAWDELGASMQLMLTGFVARAVQDVLEVEQVMYRALGKVLEQHAPMPIYVLAEDCKAPEDHQHGSTADGGDDICWDEPTGEVLCRECRDGWGERVEHPCPTFAAGTAALAGVEGEG